MRAFPAAESIKIDLVQRLEISAAVGVNSPIFIVEAVVDSSPIKCILKVCSPMAKYRRDKVVAEVVLQRFLRNNLGSEQNRLLIPIVYDYDAEGQILFVDGVGHEYILMEWREGKPLTEELANASTPHTKQQLEACMRQLAHFIADLKSFWIVPTDLMTGSVQHIEIVDPRTRSVSVVAGLHANSLVPPQRSLSAGIQQLVIQQLEIVSKIIDQLNSTTPNSDGETVIQAEEGLRSGTAFKSAAWYTEQENRMKLWLQSRFDPSRPKELVDHTFSELFELLGNKDLVHLAHNDVHCGNLLVDPLTLELKAILDFEYAGLSVPISEYFGLLLPPGISRTEFEALLADEWAKLPSAVTTENGRPVPPFPPQDSELNRQTRQLMDVLYNAVVLARFHSWPFGSREERDAQCGAVETATAALKK